MYKYIGGCLLFISQLGVAQIDSVQLLKDIQILEHKHSVSDRHANEMEGNIVFAGKKNEVIDLKKYTISTVNNDARQVFATVPGISVWESDGSGLQINIATRGLSPNRSWEFNTRQNGYDISSDPLGYPEAYYNPPIEAVERVVLMRGGSALQYGSQFGGMIDYKLLSPAKSKKINYLGKQTAGSYGLFNSFNMLSGTAKNVSYAVWYNFKRGDGWRKNNKYNAHNGFAQVGVQLNKHWRIEGEYTYSNYIAQQPGGLTDSMFAYDARQSTRSRNFFNVIWNMPAVKLSYNKRNFSFTWQTFGLIGFRNSVGFTKPVNLPDTISSTTKSYADRQLDKDEYLNIGTEWRARYNYKLGKMKQTLSAGVRFFMGNTLRQQQGKGDNGTGFSLALQDSIFPKELKYRNYNGAVFAENIFRVGRLAIVPGFRLEIIHSAATGYISLDSNRKPLAMRAQNSLRIVPLGGVGVEYHFHKAGEIYANLTQAYRPVLFSELTPSATTDSIDPKLKDAGGFTADLGYRAKWKNYLELDISGYYMIYDNKIGSVAMKNSSGQLYLFKTNVGQSHHRGVEAFVRLNAFDISAKTKNWGKLSLWMSLTYCNAIYTQLTAYKTTGGAIEPISLKGNRVEYAPRFINRFGLDYRYKFFSIGAMVHWVDEVYTDAANTKEPNTTATVGLLPAYWVADANVAFEIWKDKITLKASLTNLTNNSYATRRSGGYPGPGLLPGEGRSVNFSIVTTLGSH